MGLFPEKGYRYEGSDFMTTNTNSFTACFSMHDGEKKNRQARTKHHKPTHQTQKKSDI